MLIFVPKLIDYLFASKRIKKCYYAVILIVCMNVMCLWLDGVAAGPTSQQEQELMLLEALSKRQPSYYGTSNSIMDILGRSTF